MFKQALDHFTDLNQSGCSKCWHEAKVRKVMLPVDKQKPSMYLDSRPVNDKIKYNLMSTPDGLSVPNQAKPSTSKANPESCSRMGSNKRKRSTQEPPIVINIDDDPDVQIIGQTPSKKKLEEPQQAGFRDSRVPPHDTKNFPNSRSVRKASDNFESAASDNPIIELRRSKYIFKSSSFDQNKSSSNIFPHFLY